MSDISDDVRAKLGGWLEAFILKLLNGGRGFSQTIATQGDGNDHQIVPSVKGIRPAVNLINWGASTLKYGYGNADCTLLAGAAITLRWRDPAGMNLVYNDGGVVFNFDVVS